MGFRISLDPQLFLNRVDYNSYLRGLASTTTAFVSVKDIESMRRDGASQGQLEMALLGDTSLIAILRGAKSKRNVIAYEDADIRVTAVAHDYAFSHQAFAQVDKMQSLVGLEDTLLRGRTPYGLPRLPPAVFQYHVDGNTFTALYVPPIVEIIPAGKFETVLDVVRKRIAAGESLDLDVHNGHPRMSLAALLADAERLLAGRETIPTVVDGTHRTLLAYNLGMEYRAVLIHGSKRSASSLPLRFENITLTNTKPKRREDGYPGHNEQAEMNGWLNWKELGIDN